MPAIVGKMPASAINKNFLLPKSYGDLIGKDGQVRSMALAHARETFFGKEVMVQCTAHG